jgi:hypothetical protein
MPRTCAQCAAEYVDSVEMCSDCQVPLPAAAPPFVSAFGGPAPAAKFGRAYLSCAVYGVLLAVALLLIGAARDTLIDVIEGRLPISRITWPLASVIVIFLGVGWLLYYLAVRLERR